MKNYVNHLGGCYFACNAYGWKTARTPWEALQGLDFYPKVPTIRGRKWEEATSLISLYYLPNEDKFQGTSYYAPIDAEGKPYGIPLYAGIGEHNVSVIHKILTNVDSCAKFAADDNEL